MEFYISGSVRGESGWLSIIGRCGEESLHPGVEFRAIMKEKPRRYPDGLEQPREIEKCHSVHIRIEEVEAYGKKVEFLPACTTGVLRCVSDSVDLVPGGWILTDQCLSTTA